MLSLTHDIFRKGSPARKFVLLLVVLFFADLLKDLCVPLLMPGMDFTTAQLTDSFLTTLLAAPFLWWFVIRPLSGASQMERALRESEIRFREVFEQSEDAIIFFKPGSTAVIDANTTAERLYGYTREELKFLGLECLCRPADLPWLGNVIRGIRRDEPSRIDRVVGCRKDGTELVATMHGKVMRLSEIDITYCTFRDVTDRTRMEEEARAIQSRLIQANKMTSLGLLVSGVAHEINNPNNFIMSNSQFLAGVWEDVLKVLREHAREHGDVHVGGISLAELEAHSPQLFDGIIDGSRRIDAIVNSLKNYARQDSTVTIRDVDINEVATTAASILHHEIVKHTERFHLDLDEHIPPVRGSNQQLAQVVINLLMNACQALPTKQHGIWVATSFDAAAGEVLLTVRDEGRGIAKELVDRVLEPFFTTKLEQGGTGLGLSISQAIVKEHHGSLEFVSEPGRGAQFVVKLPAGAMP